VIIAAWQAETGMSERTTLTTVAENKQWHGYMWSRLQGTDTLLGHLDALWRTKMSVGMVAVRPS
jgi:hypothetical protein